MELSWDVVESLGQTKTFDVVINFPIMDINRNALRKKRDQVLEASTQRMNLWWGDDSWSEEFYKISPQLRLFEEDPDMLKSVNNDDVVNTYCRRVKEIAGFEHVSIPFPVKNTFPSTMYYIIFASSNKNGARIMADVLKKIPLGDLDVTFIAYRMD